LRAFDVIHPTEPVFMKLISIAVACALFFAAVITELHLRLWPESRLALLALTTLSLLVTAFIGARFGSALRAGEAAPAPGVPADAAADRRPSGRSPRAEGAGRPREDAGSRRRSEPRGNGSGGEGRNRSRPAPEHQAPAVPADAEREQGEVKWFNRTKGFGFIIRANGEEIFVHQRAIRSADAQRRPVLRDGQQVSFVVVARERGLQAEDVIDLEESA
jgi:cold shock CspA family protein